MPISERYDGLELYVRVIAGAGTSILFLQYLYYLMSQNTFWNTSQVGNAISLSPDFRFLNPPLVYFFAPLAALFLASPIILSFLFSRKDVELANLRVVPPIAIAALTAVYAAIFILGFPTYFPANTYQQAVQQQDWFFGFFSVFVFGMVAYVEDGAAVRILGRAAERDSIYFEKLRVHAGIEDVRSKLSIPEIRANFSIGIRIDGDGESGYTLQSPARIDIKTIINLRSDEVDKSNTIVSAAFYNKARYSVRFTDYFLESAKKDVAYLFDVLNEREPRMGTDTLVPLTNASNDSFINYVIDDLRGYYVATKKASIPSLVLGLAVVGLAAVIGFAYVTGQPAYVLQAAGAIDGLIAIVAVMDYLSKRR